MKIGLVRHFKVNHDFPTGKYVTADFMDQWFKDYDEADIVFGETPLLDVEWKACYTSDMSRAVKTAEHIYPDKIIQMKELREIPSPSLKGKVKLPFLLWAIWIRCSSFLNKQTRLEIKKAEKRINVALDIILANEGQDTLIVSHAALMVYIRKELIRRGFSGPKYSVASNGKLYMFEK